MPRKTGKRSSKSSTAASKPKRKKVSKKPRKATPKPKVRRKTSKSLAVKKKTGRKPKSRAKKKLPARKKRSPKKAKPVSPKKKSLRNSESLMPSSKHFSSKFIGAHVSMSGGHWRACVNAASIGARAFALDIRNKRRWESPPLSDADAKGFREACKKFGYSPDHILPHGSYLINLGSPRPEILSKSKVGFLDELQRCEKLGLKLYNFHPGSSLGESEAVCLKQIADCINWAHSKTETVVTVIENMAGQGSVVGHSFDQIRAIIDRVKDKKRVGVCLDTCHLFGAGHDVSTKAAWDIMMADFDSTVGLKYLRGMHLNDSQQPLGSRKDRHEHIGKGLIGIECFRALMNDKRLDNLPLIIETPHGQSGPDVDYKESLKCGRAVFKKSKGKAGVDDDVKNLRLLDSLVK
eukprot:221974_1